jgi:hypothetical protein
LPRLAREFIAEPHAIGPHLETILSTSLPDFRLYADHVLAPLHGKGSKPSPSFPPGAGLLLKTRIFRHARARDYRIPPTASPALKR